jgi:hypothetical protein
MAVLSQSQQPQRDKALDDAQTGIDGVKGNGGFACLIFAVILGVSFWAGAVVASQPWVH